MRLLTQSTATNVMVFVVLTTDHITGATGLTLTITASKDGGAFASITPTVTERGNGWYNLALTTSHTDTTGDLAIHATGTGADAADVSCRVTNWIETADALLKRDMSLITGEATRSLLNAIRFLRNKWSLSSTTLTVTKEDDSTTAWTGTVSTTPGADPITSNDPT